MQPEPHMTSAQIPVPAQRKYDKLEKLDQYIIVETDENFVKHVENISSLNKLFFVITGIG
jgi:hypothetical protein